MKPRFFMMPILLLVVLFPPIAQAAGEARLERQFARWLEHEIWPQAQAAGVPRQVFDRALRGVRLNLKLPDLVLPGQKPVPAEQQQAEFAAPGRYFNERSLRIHARRGRELLRRHGRLLARIERRFGVPGEIVLAIWARESNYGRAPIRRDAFTILATQAFMGRRAEMFTRELLAALEMVARGHARPGQMKSSWAGALGQPQFLPSVFLRLAVDFDGDGRRDIWNSVPDTLASIANHLKRHGWRRGVPWGVEVALPSRLPCHLEGPDQGRTPAWWRQRGVRAVANTAKMAALARQRKLYLLTPAGRHGPAFLVSENFHVLKSYNMSDLYALFIGHLSERIGGRQKGFATPWQDVGHMKRADVAFIQRKLERLGHDVGGVDGLPGFRTRRSIGRHEARMGWPVRCFPTAELLERMRAGR